MLFRWPAWLMVLSLSIVAQQATLARVSDGWRYFKGTNAPSTPPSAWQQSAFDDSPWLTGVGGFSIGQVYDENTVLADMPARYLSVFFRKKFTVTDPQAVKWFGVHTLVTGGGGSLLYPFIERDRANAQFWSVYHCTKITVNGDTLRLEALDTNGVVFDGMTIQRAMPPPQVYQASWHSPALESKPPDDGDGNINCQTFDFVGTPIPTLPGEFGSVDQQHGLPFLERCDREKISARIFYQSLQWFCGLSRN